MTRAAALLARRSQRRLASVVAVAALVVAPVGISRAFRQPASTPSLTAAGAPDAVGAPAAAGGTGAVLDAAGSMPATGDPPTPAAPPAPGVEPGVAAPTSAAIPGGTSGEGSDGAPSASEGGEETGRSAAVVTPLLKTMRFGTKLGMTGVGCNLGGSLIVAAGNELGAGDAISDPASQGVAGCVQLGKAFEDMLTQAIAASGALTLMNPLLNPIILELAEAVEQFGTTYSDELAPFGPSVRTLGPTIAFLAGS